MRLPEAARICLGIVVFQLSRGFKEVQRLQRRLLCIGAGTREQSGLAQDMVESLHLPEPAKREHSAVALFLFVVAA